MDNILKSLEYATNLFNDMHKTNIKLEYAISKDLNVHIIEENEIHELHYEFIDHLKTLYSFCLGINFEYHSTNPGERYIKLNESGYIYIPKRYKNNLYICN